MKDTRLLMNLKPKQKIIEAMIKDINGMKKFLENLQDKTQKKSKKNEHKLQLKFLRRNSTTTYKQK